MDALTREARRMTMKRRVHEKRSLMDLPTEILLQILGYLLQEFSPSGHLSKLAPAGQNDMDDPAREAIPGDEVAKVAKLRDSVASLMRRLRLWVSASSSLSVIMVNKRLHSVGIDILYSINTITLTSLETIDLVQQPGLVALLRNLRIHERDPRDSILADGGTGEHESLLHAVLHAPRLQTLHIDIEPFFVKKCMSLHGNYAFNQRGLQHCLKIFNLHTCVAPRPTDLASYVLRPLPPTHAFERRRPHPWLTKRLLRKLTLHSPSIAQTWASVAALPLADLLALAWRRGYPHDLFSAGWYCPPTSRKNPTHTLYDWMICLRAEISIIQPHFSRSTVKILLVMPMVNGERFEIPVVRDGGSGWGNHFWTVLFLSESIRARNGVVEAERRAERRRRRERWGAAGSGFGLRGGDGRGGGERFRLVGM